MKPKEKRKFIKRLIDEHIRSKTTVDLAYAMIKQYFVEDVWTFPTDDKPVKVRKEIDIPLKTFEWHVRELRENNEIECELLKGTYNGNRIFNKKLLIKGNN